MANGPEPSLLVAVELGAEWPCWMSELFGESPRRVVAQLQAETFALFSQRVRALAAAARATGAVVLFNARLDRAQSTARRELLATLDRQEHFEFLVVGAAERSRFALEKLVKTCSPRLKPSVRGPSSSNARPKSRKPARRTRSRSAAPLPT